jgi:hypothetical protein
MCAVMVRLSSLEADDPLRPLLPLQRGLSCRGSCELTGARVNEGLCPWRSLLHGRQDFWPPKSIVEFLYICTIETRSGCA